MNPCQPVVTPIEPSSNWGNSLAQAVLAHLCTETVVEGIIRELTPLCSSVAVQGTDISVICLPEQADRVKDLIYNYYSHIYGNVQFE